jgi:NAD(P)-dependent dehydrogenase (short-subunit alcohol dehydrogenase family)
VVAAARTEHDVARVAAQHERVTACPADVSSEADVARIVGVALERGRLAGWVNCAAVLEKTAIADMELRAWRSQLAVNLDGVFLCCRAALRCMRDSGGGTIVNLASLSGVANVEKFPGLAAYNVGKAGVIALSEAVALEGRDDNVRCVCVSPGAVDTDMLRAAAPHLRAGMTPDDMAAIVAFLLTPAAAPLSGTNIPIFSNA